MAALKRLLCGVARAGPVLGKGTALFRAFLEKEAAAPPSGQLGQLALAQNGSSSSSPASPAAADPGELQATLQIRLLTRSKAALLKPSSCGPA
jgi:hypothetical protein